MKPNGRSETCTANASKRFVGRINFRFGTRDAVIDVEMAPGLIKELGDAMVAAIKIKNCKHLNVGTSNTGKTNKCHDCELEFHEEI